MKEIGGYFGLEELVNNEYHKNLIALNIGRNPLLYLVNGQRYSEIVYGILFCDSVSNTLKLNMHYRTPEKTFHYRKRAG